MPEILKVKVIANAKKTELAGEMEDGTIKIRIHATREKWKANEELLRFLGEEYGGKWEIVSGATSTRKIVRIVS